MPLNVKQTSPDNIRYLWYAIATLGQDSASHTKVMKYLTNIAEYQNNEAEKLLKNALHDGLIVLGNGNQNNGRPTKAYKIPNIKDIVIDENLHDFYCYECHIPGKDLQHCVECLRSFHEKCWHSNPDEPNNSKSIIPNKRRVEISVNDYETHTSNYRAQNSSSTNIKTNEQNELPDEIEVDNNNENASSRSQSFYEIYEIEIENRGNREEEETQITENTGNVIVKDEYLIDIKPENEVICIGEIRPPSRRLRENASIVLKWENFDHNDENILRSLCSWCRVMKKSKFRDPPNMTEKEINYLLRFVYETIKSWISLDTFTPKANSNSWAMPSKKCLDIFKKLCFKFPKSLSDIDNKIKHDQYTSLSEFQCDFMDLRHCMGILFGTELTEYIATSYLLSDCIYELSEIRQCRDCYRNSNQKSDPFWFCKPCVPRHELVFAKQVGYSYWPAKVMRVTENQYDVRFFGGNHSRAVVDANNVKPIDIDIHELKIKRNKFFDKAMDELRKHELLLQHPPGQFSFNEEVLNNNINYFDCPEITEEVMISTASKVNRSRKIEQISNTTTVSSLQESQESQGISLTGSRRRKRKIINNTSSVDENYDNNDILSSTTNGTAKKTKTPISTGKTKNRIRSLLNILGIREFLYRKSMNATDDISSTSTLKTSSLSIKKADLGKKTKHDHTDVESSNDDKSPELSTRKADKSIYSAVDELRRTLSTAKNVKNAKKLALIAFKAEIDNLHEKINELKEEHKKEILKIKKQTWCVCCGKPGNYHCCWNANYCSTKCQQKHWNSEHKKKCVHSQEAKS